MGTKKNGRSVSAQADYTAQVPFEPPEGLLEWTLSNWESLQRNVLVYKLEWVPDPITGLRHREVSGWCSACGETTMFDYYGGLPSDCSKFSSRSSAPYGFIEYSSIGPQFRFDGEDVMCPHCAAKVRALHCGSFREHYHLGTAWPVTVGRVEDRLVLSGWYVDREIWKHGGRAYQVHTQLRPYEAYVVEKRKIVRLKAYSRFMSQVRFEGGWKQVKHYSDEWGEAGSFFPWDKKLLEGSTAENSKLDLYLRAGGKSRPVSYLYLWIKHKNAENLVMQGAGALLNDLMDRAVYSTGYYGYATKCNIGRITDIDWTQRQPSRMLGLNKEEFRLAVRLGLDTWGLRMIRMMRESGQTLRTDEEILACKKFGAQSVCAMSEKGLPVLKIVRYLTKQRQRYPKDNSNSSVSFLEDYWAMAQKAGDDLSDPRVRWPQHLSSAHDSALLRIRWETKAELEEGFAAVRQRMDRLSFEKDGLIIRICQDQNALIREGKFLHHCVANYAKTHSEGKHVIFFIRRAENPDLPWFTLEYDTATGTVLQNRGKYNCSETREVIAFKKAWLVWISRGAPRLPDGTPDVGQSIYEQESNITKRKAG